MKKTSASKRFLTLFLTAAILIPCIVSAAGAVMLLPQEYFDLADKVAVAVEEYAPSYKFPSGSNITVEDHQHVMDLLLQDYPMLFNLLNSWSYYTNAAGYVTRIEFSYRMTVEEYRAARIEVDAWANEVLSLTDPTFTDFEYALFFHDYIVMNYDYDTELMEGRTAYMMIKSRYGVCMAYTLLYGLLLDKVGIDNTISYSDAMNHVWNLVKIDGEWYHADLTWDDPVGNAPGQVLHDNFLRSDSGIGAEGHYSFYSKYACTSAKYDTAAYIDAESSYAHVNGNWYYLDSDSDGGDLYVTSDPTVKGTVFMNMDLRWNTYDGIYHYLSCQSTLISVGNHLYMNTDHKLIRIDAASRETKVIGEYNKNGLQMFGFVIDLSPDGIVSAGLREGKVQVFLCKDADYIDTGAYLPLKLYEEPLLQKGDADENGKVNITDVSLMLKHIAKWSDITINTSSADYDSNGKININDVTAVMKKIANGR